MSHWSKDELRRIAHADHVSIAPFPENGSADA
jgi:hypothetical protein